MSLVCDHCGSDDIGLNPAEDGYFCYGCYDDCSPISEEEFLKNDKQGDCCA